MMKSRFAVFLALLLAHPGHSAQVHDTLIETLSNRLFPMLTLIGNSDFPQHRPEGDQVRNLLAQRKSRMAACGDAPSCLYAAATWEKSERSLLANWAERDLRGILPQGSQIPDDGIGAQVERELAGLNQILRVYGLGDTPRFPEIDGPDKFTTDWKLGHGWEIAVALGHALAGDPLSKLDPSIGFALALLDGFGRDDAASFEPLDAAYNGPALARAKNINWSEFDYSAIIVLGEGPEDLTKELSAEGKLNLHLAATRFFDGVAPFIIVTGGAVHPRGTKHVEAIEMKQALIARYGVPADCIVVEPYARHTTTNLRNATRRLIALGAPLSRDAAIITFPWHSAYIENPNFNDRNARELGYQPGLVGERRSPSELLFHPLRTSLRVDPMDPLDP